MKVFRHERKTARLPEHGVNTLDADVDRRRSIEKALAVTSGDSISCRDLRSLERESKKNHLPVFYLEHIGSRKFFLYKEISPEYQGWQKHMKKGDEDLWGKFAPGEFNFFLKSPGSREAVLLASGGQKLHEKLKDNFFISRSLRSTGSKRSPSPKTIVDLAGLFHSGVFVPQDQDYAKKLLSLIEDSKVRSSSLDEEMINSILPEEDLPLTKSLLELGADPNSSNSAGWQPLTTAIARGNYEAAKLLLQFGASATEYDAREGGSAIDLMEQDGGYDSSSSLDRLIMKAKAREEKETP